MKIWILLLGLIGCTIRYTDEFYRDQLAEEGILSNPDSGICTWRIFDSKYHCKRFESLRETITKCVGRDRERNHDWIEAAFDPSCY